MGKPQTIVVAVVDDDVELRMTLKRYLSALGCETRQGGSIAEGRRLLEREAVDVALVDFRLLDGDGPELIRWITASGRARFAYCMTGYATCGNVVAAMRAGSLDVLAKPFDMRAIAALVTLARPHPDDLGTWRRRCAPELLGNSGPLRDALHALQRAAGLDAAVLVTGEGGTGKELAARALHRASARCDGPFLTFRPTGLPESRAAAELLGEPGAPGLLARASGGTLFIDEIGDLPARAQAVLLRALRDRSVEQPGDEAEEQPVDVRVIASSRRDPDRLLAAGGFRADLLFRLGVLRVAMPPLRARPEDILPVAENLLALEGSRGGASLAGFDPAATEALREHTWPGNVRELVGAIAHAVAQRRSGVIAAEDLPFSPPRAPAAAGAQQRLRVSAGPGVSRPRRRLTPISPPYDA